MGNFTASLLGPYSAQQKRVAAEAESVTTEKAEAIPLQVKLNERELALAASETERLRLRNIIDEKDQYIDDLEAEVARHRESTQGIDTLKQTWHKVWTNICDVVERGWNQLLKYQELKEQVVSAIKSSDSSTAKWKLRQTQQSKC